MGSSRVAVPADFLPRVWVLCPRVPPLLRFLWTRREGRVAGFLPECLERFGGFFPSQLLLRGRQDALVDLLEPLQEPEPILALPGRRRGNFMPESAMWVGQMCTNRDWECL